MDAQLKRHQAGSRQGSAHYFALRVYIEDTDLGGVVYHANYLRFLERARSDLLRSIGIDQRAVFETGQGIYVVTELCIKFRRPARFDDELVVVTQVDEIHGASCALTQKILRAQDLLAEATVTVAFLTSEGRPRRQPAEWVEKFQRLKAKAG